MGRAPCCDEKDGLKRGRWSTEEDERLMKYIQRNGEGSWKSLAKNAGLLRCGKSCRLRWLNYLREDLKRGDISADEENLIIKLHNTMGNRWSLIAGHLPGRTDNEIKNYWNSHLSRKLGSFIRRPGSSNSSQSLPITIAKMNRRGLKQEGGSRTRATMRKKNNHNAPKPTRATKKTSATQKEKDLADIPNQEQIMMKSSNIPMQQTTEGEEEEEEEEEMTTTVNKDPLSSERKSLVLCCSEEDGESKEEMSILGPVDETADMMVMSCPSSSDGGNGSNIVIMENGVMSSNEHLSSTEYTDQSGVNTDIKATTSGVDQLSSSSSNGGGSSSSGNQNENGDQRYVANSTITTSSSPSRNMTCSNFEVELRVCDWDDWVGDILESNTNLLWEETVKGPTVNDDLMLSCWLGGENQW